MKYEYTTIELDLTQTRFNHADDKLDELADKGWRVSQTLSYDSARAVFLMERKGANWLQRQLQNKRTRLFIYWTIVALGLLPFAMVLIGKVLSK